MLCMLAEYLAASADGIQYKLVQSEHKPVHHLLMQLYCCQNRYGGRLYIAYDVDIMHVRCTCFWHVSTALDALSHVAVDFRLFIALLYRCC
jgi:hypothetical protein